MITMLTRTKNPTTQPDVTRKSGRPSSPIVNFPRGPPLIDDRQHILL
jgi:hypothetical protein